MVLVLAVLSSPRAAVAAGSGWSVEAARMESSAAGVVTASGAVEMREKGGDTVIRADRVVYDRRNAKVKAAGGVEVLRRDDRLVADAADIDLDTGDIAVRDGLFYYDPAHLYVKAGEMWRVGKTRWRFSDLLLSTCRIGPRKTPDWAFGAARGRITVDGYAFLSHVTFRVGGAPVFYLPWLVLPAKTTRQSGFLFPWFASSQRDGLALATPFFLNLSPSADITLYPGYYEKRGGYMGVEARARGGRSAGLLSASYLHDRTGETVPADGDFRGDGILRREHDRWWLRGKLARAAGPFSLHSSIDSASDQDFLLETRDGVDGFDASRSAALAMFSSAYQDPGLAMRENTLSAAAAGGYGFAGIQAVAVDDLEEETRPGAAVHTLPRLAADLRLPGFLAGTTTAVAADYHHYYRRQGEGYQRLYLRPQLVAPFPWRLFEGRVSVGADERVYRLRHHGDGSGESGGRERHGLVARANMAATFSRLYPAVGLRHGVRPNLVYSFADADGRGPVADIDAYDGFADENRLTWELNNYFWVSGGKAAGERLAARLKFFQDYDLIEARRGTGPRRPFGPLQCDLEIFPGPRFYFRYQAALDMYGDHVTSTRVEGRYRRGETRVSLDYTESATARDLTASVEVRPWQRVGLSYETVESFLYDHKVRETAAVTYEPGCWALSLEAGQDASGRRLVLVVTLSGIGRGLRFSADGS